jgi:hypothetical protein
MGRRLARVLVIVTALLGASGQVTSNAKGSPDHEPKTIVGAWLTNVTPTLQPPFVSLGTFNSDGGLSNTTSASLAFPTETPGHGQWVRTGRDTFAITFLALIGDSPGKLAATAKGRATLTLGDSGDEFTGVFQVDL